MKFCDMTETVVRLVIEPAAPEPLEKYATPKRWPCVESSLYVNMKEAALAQATLMKISKPKWWFTRR